MIRISDDLSIPETEIEIHAVRARGAGGQNVNKVSSAVHLRLDIPASSLPEPVKEKLLSCRDSRISDDGVIVIKAQNFRSQERNREDALQRLQALVESATQERKPRIPTRPTRASKEKRLANKSRRGKLKTQRARVQPSDD